jgi:uncharacterized membrane protein
MGSLICPYRFQYLKMTSDEPKDISASEDDLTSDQLASLVSEKLGRPISPEDLDAPDVIEGMMEVTTGAYPPPSMLRDYRDLDEGLFQEIIAAARSQREHRQKLEGQLFEDTRSLRNRGQYLQVGLAALGLILAAAMVVVPSFWGISIPWPVPVAVAAIGVGGLPVATILARAMGMSSSEKPNND